MPLWKEFVGHAYQTRSPVIGAEELINLYVDTQTSKTNPKQATLYGTPGLIPLVTTGDVVCRGGFYQDGRQWVVVGSSVYELVISGTPPTLTVTANFIGTVAIDTPPSPVYFASDGGGGNQLAISAAGSLYILNLNTNVLSSAIVLPLTNPCGQVDFLNGRFILVEQNSLAFWYSAFEDGTTWPGLNFAKRSNTSDNIVGMAIIHDQIRLLGSKTSEIWYNVGNVDNPFLPLQGTLVEWGAFNAQSIAKIGGTIAFMGVNKDNKLPTPVLWGNGAPQPVTTPALDYIIGQYAVTSDVEVLPYRQEGHEFVAWSFPTQDVTWCYDIREDGWHKRLYWDGTNFHRWRARGVFAPDKQVIVVGDYQSGNIYQLSLDRFDDNCHAIKRVRRAPYPDAENQFIFIHQIELGMQPGTGIAAATQPQNLNAQVNLTLSRNYGKTFTPSRVGTMGASGSDAPTNNPDDPQRCFWGPSGRCRKDRLVLEINTTTTARVVFGPGLWMRSVEGAENV